MSDAHPSDDEDVRARSGTVTRIEPQQRNTHRLSIFLDGEFALGVESEVLLEWPLTVGDRLDEDRWHLLRDADERLRARQIAFGLLGRRARTEAEVRQALHERHLSAGAIDHTLTRLHTLGYLDDRDFALRYVESRQRARSYGPLRLRRELLRRGVDRAIVEEALRPIDEGADLVDIALTQAQRNRKWQSEPDLRKRRKKASDFLARRGFDYDTIEQAIDRLFRETPDEPDDSVSSGI